MSLIRSAPTVDPPGAVRLLVLYGSHAHGTATPTSDEDWRGVYQAPTDGFLGLDRPHPTWERKEPLADGKPDMVMWELGHFCRLLVGGNPNIVGLLSAPDDCVADICPVISLLRANRGAFVSRSMAAAYLGWVGTELRHDPAVLTPKRLSHIPRLLWELEEAMDTGTIPVRLSGWRLDYVREVKAGKIDLADVRARAEERIPVLGARGRQLPDAPRDWVNDVLVRARHGEFG